MLWQEIEYRWNKTRCRFPPPQNTGDWITLIRAYLERENFTTSPAPNNTPSAHNRIILINEDFTITTLMSLAYQYGDWIAYARNYLNLHTITPQQRNGAAFKWGWCFIKLIKAPITRKEWVNYHTDNEDDR